MRDPSDRIASWRADDWSHAHNGRPTTAGGLLAGAELSPPFPPQVPRPIPMPEGGDRNAVPIYAFPRSRVTSHFVREAPLRASALRSLGAHLNVFAVEGFMDELVRGGRRSDRLPAGAPR